MVAWNSIASLALCAALNAAPALAQEAIDASEARIAPYGFRPQWILAGEALPRNLVEVSTSDAFASVGRGFDPVTNTILDVQCVKPMPGTEAPLKGTLPFVAYDVVNSVKSHAGVSGSSLSAGVIYKGVSLGFGSSNSQGDYFNNVDSFVRLYARIATEGREWRDVLWADGIEKLLANDRAEFVRQCGTRYVRAVFSGHLLDATLRFKLLESNRTIADAASVSLGVEKLFGLSAGDAKAESDLATRSSARLWSQGRGALALPPAPEPEPGAAGRGGAVAQPSPSAPKPDQPAPTPPAPPEPPKVDAAVAPGGVTQLIRWYNTGFAAAVDKAVSEKRDATPLYILVDDYAPKFRLRYRLTIPTLSEDISREIASTADQYANLVTTLSTADYAGELHPSNQIFFEGTPDEVRQTATDARNIFVAYAQAVESCRALAALGSAVLPDRQTKASDACKTKLDDALAGMQNLRITRKY